MSFSLVTCIVKDILIKYSQNIFWEASMSIKNARTINEYKIMKWVEENFMPDSVSVELISDTHAIITDHNKETMEVVINNGNVTVV